MLECSKLVVKSMQDDKTTEEELFEWPFPSVNHVVLSQMASSRFYEVIVESVKTFVYLTSYLCKHVIVLLRATFRFKELFEWFLASVDSLCELKSF